MLKLLAELVGRNKKSPDVNQGFLFMLGIN